MGIVRLHKDTQASIANDATLVAFANTGDVPVLSQIGSTSLLTTPGRGVIVQATSTEDVFSVSAAGAVGGIGGAGSGNVFVFDSDTTASIGDRTSVNEGITNANALQSVFVQAGNQLETRSIAGGLAIGGSALAGAADIGVVRNDTSAIVGDDTDLNSREDIVVQSLAIEQVDSLAVGGGAGGTLAFAAAVAVWTIGTKFDPTYSDDNSTTNSLYDEGRPSVDQQVTTQAGASRNSIRNALNNFQHVADPNTPDSPTPDEQLGEILRGVRQQVETELPTANALSNDLFDEREVTGTTASVHPGARLNAEDDIVVRANSSVNVNALTGAVSAAPIVALGAAVTVERTHIKTDASFSGIIESADVVTIEAESNIDTDGKSLAGSGAIGVALSGAVTSIRDESSTTARIDGSSEKPAQVLEATSVIVAADGSSNISTIVGQGVLAGVVGAGVTVAKSLARGETQALVGDFVDIGQAAGTTVDNLQVTAESNNLVDADAKALAAGVLASASLNFATADASPVVRASLGSTAAQSQSNIAVAGAIMVEANDRSSATTDMFGVSLAGGATLGVSRAQSIVSPTVAAAVGQGTDIGASGNVSVRAIHNRPVVFELPNGNVITLENGATANAEAGAAAAIAGNTARALTDMEPTVTASILNGASITTDGALDVLAEANNRAISNAGALTVGLVSGGGVEVGAKIAGTAHARVRDGVVLDVGSASILANSFDRSLADGTAATGGIVAGSAVSAASSIQPQVSFREPVPTVSASISGSTIESLGNVNVQAKQVAESDAFARGVVVGGIVAGQSDALVSVTPLLESEIRSSTVDAADVTVIAKLGEGGNPSVTAMDVDSTEAIAKDERSIAFAQGSAGALLASVGSTASTTYRPKLDASVHSSMIHAEDVRIDADADATSAAISRNVSGGLVAAGDARANLNMNQDLSATVTGTAEFGETVINATGDITVRVDSDQVGDAFSNTRAVALLPDGTASTTIASSYDLSAAVGDSSTLNAGDSIVIESEVTTADFGSQRDTEPGNPENLFGRPNYFGANANADTGGLSAEAFATASTRLGTASAPATAVVSLGAFSKLTAPNVTLAANVSDIVLTADSSARSGGVDIDVSSIAVGEVHSDIRVELKPNSVIDATNTILHALNGTSPDDGIRSEVESMVDKDGIDFNPIAIGTNRMDTHSTITGFDGSSIATRNLEVRADTLITQFDLLVLKNNTPNAGTGTEITEFIRERDIHWESDVLLKGAASPRLTIVDGATGATVTEAIGVTIDDTDGIGFGTGTIGNVEAPTIIVNPISNSAPYGDILFEIPRRGATNSDNGTIDGTRGSFTIARAFDEVVINNQSRKPMRISSISPINLSSPEIVIDAPVSALLSFPVFQDFGDTQIDIDNGTRNIAPSLTLTGLINNPVGEIDIDSGGPIGKSGAGKLVANVVDIKSTSGNTGSSSQRIPIDLVLSDGRQHDLNVQSAGTLFLDLTARDRREENHQPLRIEASNITAASTLNMQLRTTLRETTLPNALPLLTVNEVQENDITHVVAFFETPEEIIDLDLGALAANPSAVPSEWVFDRLTGSSIVSSMPSPQLAGPLTHLTATTNVGSGNITATMNGDISLSESTGSLRVNNINSTAGDVSLTSNSTIVAAPIDAAADISGRKIELNAAGSMGAANGRLDINSRSRVDASAVGNIFLTETAGDLSVGSITATNGNVDLIAAQGAILDVDADAAADVSGNNITLAATSSSIGTDANALELDSASGGAGSVRATAVNDIHLVEVGGNMSLMRAVSSQGDIRIEVPDTTSVSSNLTLPDATITAPLGVVQFAVGDDFTSTSGTILQAAGFHLAADSGNVDPGVGSTIALGGSFAASPMLIATSLDPDSINLQQTVLQGALSIQSGSGDDTITVNQLAPYTSTTAGVRDVLSINTGSGNNTLVVNSNSTGNFIASLADSDRSGSTSLELIGTSSNDAILLNQSQAAFVHPGNPPTSEIVLLGAGVVQVTVVAGNGDDNFAINLAAGSVDFPGGIHFTGNQGNDLVLISGSDDADAFELDATSSTSGTVRTRTGLGSFSQPIRLETIEQLAFNGLLPATSPGDTLYVLNSLDVQPTLPAGSFDTPLPLVYSNFEAVQLGSEPIAANDGIRIDEDQTGIVFPFLNDVGLTDFPVTVFVGAPGFGSVVYDDNGTTNDTHDDRFVYTPPQHVSGNTSFDYIVTDSNGDASTARVFVIVEAIADAPLVAVRDADGAEGMRIPLEIEANLVDTDGSESLVVLVHGVPDDSVLTNADGERIGIERGPGSWHIPSDQLSKLHITLADNGDYVLSLEAIATESDSRTPATTSASFRVSVANTAPAAVVMEAPSEAVRGERIAVRMATNDDYPIDQSAGFSYRVNWGDGSAEEVIAAFQPLLSHTYQASGEYTVTIFATDKDGSEGAPVSHRLLVRGSGLIADPLQPGETMLVIEGTAQSDTIQLTRSGNRVNVYRKSPFAESYTLPTSRIVVWGLGGNDTISVSSSIPVDSWLFGGDGNDLLIGGSQESILVGGAGVDILRGQSSRDILFGGTGNDLLIGNGGDDILLAGYSVFDEDEVALLDIQREWTSDRSRKARIRNLTVGSEDRSNGDTFLRGEGNNPTAFDDAAIDLLINDRRTDWMLVNSDVGVIDLFAATANKEELGPGSLKDGSKNDDRTFHFGGETPRLASQTATNLNEANKQAMMKSFAATHPTYADQLWQELDASLSEELWKRRISGKSVTKG